MVKLGCLSEKYEGGGPGTISTGEGDPIGKVSYGTYQITTANVAAFVSWLLDSDEYAGLGAILQQHTPGTLEFSADWTYCAETYPEQFAQAQDEYVTPRYYDAALERLWECGICTDSLPDAIKCVLFSNAVQHGAYWAGQLLADSYDCDTAEWIRRVYNTKISDPSWSDGAPDLRPGLFARWENEKQDALTILAGGEIS